MFCLNKVFQTVSTLHSSGALDREKLWSYVGDHYGHLCVEKRESLYMRKANAKHKLSLTIVGLVTIHKTANMKNH